MSQATKIRATGLVLAGNTINSAADVVVTVQKLPNFGSGAPVAINTINIPNGTTAGNAVAGSAIAVPVDLAFGDVVVATVTTAATVAGGDGYVSLGLITN